MTVPSDDIDRILARRHDNGADYWAGLDNKVYVGNPFSTLGSLTMLHELGLGADHEAVAGALECVQRCSREDGRIRLGPKTPMYPCYSAEAARVLCRFGLSESEEVQRAVDWFLESRHEDGGWRCSFSKMGKGPETVHSNPGATLLALDVLRHFDAFREGGEAVDGAVDTLLEHWADKKPRGPCHWGIGTLFMQVEFPFLRYNLFFFVYVLSFFRRARADVRFQKAFAALSEKRDEGGRLVVERPHRALKDLEFCKKGEPSDLATRRYEEIVSNLA